MNQLFVSTETGQFMLIIRVFHEQNKTGNVPPENVPITNLNNGNEFHIVRVQN